jgi:glutamine amidotransferase
MGMIAVVDYRAGNLRSVCKALERLSCQTCITNDPRVLSSATAIVLPGVGAFSRGMESLREFGIKKVIEKHIGEGKPFLGICLGLQLLFTESEEQNQTKGLNIIKGNVVKFKEGLKVPHIGWNKINFSSNSLLFKGISSSSYFYFVHSYYPQPEDKRLVVATTLYGVEFPSVIVKDNIVGVQFHPEKSGSIGLKLLENFISHYVS